MTGTCGCGCGQATTIARSSNAPAGRTRGEPLRFVRGHNMRAGRDDEGRFLRRLVQNRESGCLEFTGARSAEGYGYFFIEGRNLKAHRAAWTFTFGPIPEGMVVCHRCDNPPCCNPLHLFLGTRADNNTDRSQKGRSARGVQYPHARLTDERVAQIRADHDAGASIQSLADRYGVARSTIHDVVHRKSWRHVPEGVIA